MKKDEALAAVMQLAQKEGWRRCDQCGSMVQLAHGCHHMTCRCGHHFCYKCGRTWMNQEGAVVKQCECDLWNEENLVEETQRRADLVQRLEHRVVAPPERQRIRQQLARDECNHGDFSKITDKHGNLTTECSNCGFFMNFYAYQCGYCSDMVCQLCRHHRL